MSAENTESNQNDINKEKSAAEGIKDSKNLHSSHSSEEHRHHHSHSHSSSRSRKKTSNLPADYEKQKKAKLWWRSLFVALTCAGLVWVVALIIDSNDEQNNWNASLSSNKVTMEELQAEVDKLRTDNLNLRYKLDKYKDEYGELDGAADESNKDVDSQKDSKSNSGNQSKTAKTKNTNK